MILFLKILRLNSVFRRGCSVEIPCGSFKKHFAKKKKMGKLYHAMWIYLKQKKATSIRVFRFSRNAHSVIVLITQNTVLLITNIKTHIQPIQLTNNENSLVFSLSLSNSVCVNARFRTCATTPFCTCVWGAAADHVSHTGLGSSSSSSSCAVTKEKPKGIARCILASSCFPFDHSPLCLCSIHLLLLVGEGILKVLHKNGQQYRSGAFTFVSF